MQTYNLQETLKELPIARNNTRNTNYRGKFKRYKLQWNIWKYN